MSPLRRWQRELGVPAPLDDTAEGPLNAPQEQDLTPALAASVMLVRRIVALEARCDELEKKLKGVAASMPVY